MELSDDEKRGIIIAIADAVSEGLFGKKMESCGIELQKKLVRAAGRVITVVAKLDEGINKTA